MNRFILSDESMTVKFGSAIGRCIRKNALIYLTGQLGAGKTYVAKGIAAGLGSEGQVSSPTYNIMNIYEFDGGRIMHFDLYRLENEEELYGVGLFDFVKNGICLIEWADKFKESLPDDYLEITLSYFENGRAADVSLSGEKYADLYKNVITKLNEDFGERS